MAKVVINDMMDKAFEIGSFSEKLTAENNFSGRLEITIVKANDIDIYDYQWIANLEITNIKLYNNDFEEVIAEFTKYNKLMSIQKYIINTQDNNVFENEIFLAFDRV